MSPSLTLDRDQDLIQFDHSTFGVGSALSLGRVAQPEYRTRRTLLTFAKIRLQELAARQQARHQGPYVVVLRLIAAIVGNGSATPQIADNGDGGIEVMWIVNGASLTVDYEDELEILVTAVGADGTRLFAHTLTAYWTPFDAAIAEAKSFLAAISAGMTARHALPLT